MQRSKHSIKSTRISTRAQSSLTRNIWSGVLYLQPILFLYDRRTFKRAAALSTRETRVWGRRTALLQGRSRGRGRGRGRETRACRAPAVLLSFTRPPRAPRIFSFLISAVDLHKNRQEPARDGSGGGWRLFSIFYSPPHLHLHLYRDSLPPTLFWLWACRRRAALLVIAPTALLNRQPLFVPFLSFLPSLLFVLTLLQKTVNNVDCYCYRLPSWLPPSMILPQVWERLRECLYHRCRLSSLSSHPSPFPFDPCTHCLLDSPLFPGIPRIVAPGFP